MEKLKKLVPIFILSVVLFLLGTQQELNERTAQAAEESNFYDSYLEFEDEIPLGCNLIANTHYNDRNNFKIDLTIPDSREWYTNIINSELKDGARIPETSDDFPEPETPVTEVIQPSGNSTFIDCKLLCLAPLIFILSLVGFFLLTGGSMAFLPLK